MNMLNGAAILMNGVGTLNGVYAIFLVSRYLVGRFSLKIFFFNSIPTDFY